MTSEEMRQRILIRKELMSLDVGTRFTSKSIHEALVGKGYDIDSRKVTACIRRIEGVYVRVCERNKHGNIYVVIRTKKERKTEVE